LEFAQRAKTVKNRPEVNRRVTDKDQLKLYERLCENYKSEIEKLYLEKLEKERTIDALNGKISNIRVFTDLAGKILAVHKKYDVTLCGVIPRINKMYPARCLQLLLRRNFD